MEFGTWVAILLDAYDTSGPAAVGVIALAQLLPAGILAPFAASLADRYPRERVLLVGYLVQAFVFGAAGARMLLGAPAIAVYIAGAAAAAALTVIRPTRGSLLPSLARTPEELTAANGLSGTVEVAGLLLGPLAAAVILGFSEPGAVFVAGSVACVAASLLVRGLPRSARPAMRVDVGASAGAPGAPDAVPHAHVGLAAGLRLLGERGRHLPGGRPVGPAHAHQRRSGCPVRAPGARGVSYG
ncbi:MAG: MFS transporter [Chloroflexi bacterium]|nr:MFS transporter [Chloroflexota bacterium]